MTETHNHPAPAARAKNLGQKILLPGLFTALLLYGWRIMDLAHRVPAYGDTLEVLWAAQWYRDSLANSAASALLNPHVFYPEGWQLATSANGPGIFLFLIPLAEIGGWALAWNVLLLISLVVAFVGMYLVVRPFSEPLTAGLAALLFTFWGARWIRLAGHFNILVGTALLPWLIFGVEKSTASPRRAIIWLVFVGVIWALMIAHSFYFLWLGGIVLACWLLGCRWNGRLTWRVALKSLLVPGVVAVGLNLPLFILFRHGQQAAQTQPFNIHVVNAWGHSLNALFIPYLAHPWQAVREISARLYQGPFDGASFHNFGLAASILLLFSLLMGRRKEWRPFLLLTVVGLVLALGVTLQWNHQTVQFPMVTAVNHLLWRIGHVLKPEIFPTAHTPELFAQAIPLPGWLLTAVIPFWEGARVAARFAFVAAMGFFPLVAFGLAAIRPSWLRYSIAAILLLEILPAPYRGVPFPPPPHPAFTWVNQQPATGLALIDLYSPQPDKLTLPIGGETLWAMSYHNRPIVNGASSVLPRHTTFLREWLWQHPHPFAEADFAPLLRSYGAEYILLHMQKSSDDQFIAGAAQNEDVRAINCFDPVAHSPIWAYPICVVSLEAPSSLIGNIRLRQGWSALESWGVWAEGQQTTAEWVATAVREHKLDIEAFPVCAPEQQQLAIYVNDTLLETRQWPDCEPWQQSVTIPAELVQIGWNRITFAAAYAISPAELTGGENPDGRALSVGFTRLNIHD